MLSHLKSWAKSILQEAHALSIAARHPRTPWYAKLLAVGIAAYALSPIDLIPDFIPVLGLLDEALLLPLAIVIVLKLIPADIIAECRVLAAQAAERPVSRAAAVFIAAIWVAAVAGTGWLAYRWAYE